MKAGAAGLASVCQPLAAEISMFLGVRFALLTFARAVGSLGVDFPWRIQKWDPISFPNRNQLVDFLAFFMDQIKLGPIESHGRRLTQGELDEVVADAAYITSMNYLAHRFGITFKEAVERFSRGRNHSPYDLPEPPSKRVKGD